jgi:hypothetical protein
LSRDERVDVVDAGAMSQPFKDELDHRSTASSRTAPRSSTSRTRSRPTSWCSRPSSRPATGCPSTPAAALGRLKTGSASVTRVGAGI